MKKVIAILAIAGFVACNSADTKTPATDSPKTTVDTTKKTTDTMAKPAVDTSKKAKM